jgi:DNA-binding NarL/FixJ family response regulator
MDALNRLFCYIATMITSTSSVLVIESHPLMRDALCAAITAEPDLKVAAQAVNGAEALRMVETLQPSMILLTLRNPVMDDMEALIALRKSMPGTPIVALTSNEVPGQEQAALNSGACMALTKASSRAVLIGKLRELRSMEL